MPRSTGFGPSGNTPIFFRWDTHRQHRESRVGADSLPHRGTYQFSSHGRASRRPNQELLCRPRQCHSLSLPSLSVDQLGATPGNGTERLIGNLGQTFSRLVPFPLIQELQRLTGPIVLCTVPTGRVRFSNENRRRTTHTIQSPSKAVPLPLSSPEGEWPCVPRRMEEVSGASTNFVARKTDSARCGMCRGGWRW